ncbi:YggT family protein [Sphingomonas ginsenosidivorax]|uniref:YggT family protein n=1 Tax=Sphingomonas ginsenosidivorax TaxID=862135 RepID=A0A5C6UIN3_9SPHN|nr:YggT family protein [Sphingomonas ginsenosidivorax]
MTKRPACPLLPTPRASYTRTNTSRRPSLLAILQILQLLLNVVWWIIVVQAILSWLIAFNVINTHSDMVRTVWTALQRMTEPLYRPIRRILPDFGALDLSPMVVLLIVYILSNIVIPSIAANYLTTVN